MTQYTPVFFDIETTGFNPLQQGYYSGDGLDGQVTAIGAATMSDEWRQGGDFEDVDADVEVMFDTSEYQLLQDAHEWLVDVTDDIMTRGGEPFLVTFNGRQFDHPYLGARYARLRLDGSLWNHNLKRLDMMRALGKNFGVVSSYPSEDDCLEACGIESEDSYDGSDMPDAFADGEYDKIREHVGYDTEEMCHLFTKLPEMCMGEFYEHYDIDADPDFTEEVEF